MSLLSRTNRVVSICLTLTACLCLWGSEASARPSAKPSTPSPEAVKLAASGPAQPVLTPSRAPEVDVCEIAKAVAAQAARDYVRSASRVGRCADGYWGCSPVLERSMQAAVVMARAHDAVAAACK